MSAHCPVLFTQPHGALSVHDVQVVNAEHMGHVRAAEKYQELPTHCVLFGPFGPPLRHEEVAVHQPHPGVLVHVEHDVA